LRRTFASILAVWDIPPRRAMYLMGHTDAKFTMSVYRQVLDVGPGSVEALETVLGCTLEEARDAYLGRGDLSLICPWRRKGPPAPSRTRCGRPEKAARLQGVQESG
jgi:hypothetical protein